MVKSSGREQTWDRGRESPRPENNILISNVTFIHFGKQGNIENFPLVLTPYEALDENSHLITLYSNITVEDCVFTNAATSNLASGGLTVATILPGWGQERGEEGTIFGLTNSGFINCLIADPQTLFGWTNGFSALSVQNCVVSGCGAAVYFEIGNPVSYGQSSLIQSNYFTNVVCGLLVNYNEVSQYPMAVGPITLVSNIIALRVDETHTNFEAGVTIDVPTNEAAIPEIPTLTAQFNKITTGAPGYPHWGLLLDNLSNALVTDNTFDDSFYAISTYSTRAPNQDYDALRMPLSYLSAARNQNASQIVEITSHGSTPTVPPIGTQQKGDFNLDGYTDLLWHNSGGTNTLWTMDATNTNSCSGALMTIGVAAMTDTNWVISGTADFTGDCNNDILWTMPGTTNLLLWTMMGPSFITSNWMPALPSGYGVAGTGDFNGDGKTDLVLTNSSTNTFLLWLMNGTSVLSNVTVSANWPTGTSQIVGAGPFNGGEQADILFRDYSTGDNYIWNMSGTTFIQKITLSAQSVTTWRIAGVGDFNGDGIADIVWRNPSTGANSIWLTSSPLSTTYTNVNLTSLAGTSWTIGGPR
jgi:hypothetical protein